jgi:oxygen-independent coproporphyrinogen-3 oxidase
MIPIKLIDAASQPASRNAEPLQTAAAFLKPGSLHLTALPPLSLYIHFPWCVKKCPYCDFNSHEAQGGFPEEAYLAALRTDLESALPLIWGRKIYTVFIGGGTPSLMSAAGLDQLLSDVRTLLPLDGAAEITMEANPGTFEAEKFRSYRTSGINRLSVGIQSFNAQHLRALGRIHDGDEARRAVDIAHANFDNFNLDLMYALPQQTLAQARADIETAIAYAPPHLSLYHLTLEPNTFFAKHPPIVPDDDASADMQDMIKDLTVSAGYAQYEVSAYAKPKRQARHNFNYWQFGDYLGIGAGAHSKLSFPHRVVRQMRYKQPKAYLEHVLRGTQIQEQGEISREDLPFEFMLNALRLNDGFQVNLFAERTGLALNAIEKNAGSGGIKRLVVSGSSNH